jgi:hypothetical protein
MISPLLEVLRVVVCSISPEELRRDNVIKRLGAG